MNIYSKFGYKGTKLEQWSITGWWIVCVFFLPCEYPEVILHICLTVEHLFSVMLLTWRTFTPEKCGKFRWKVYWAWYGKPLNLLCHISVRKLVILSPTRYASLKWLRDFLFNGFLNLQPFWLPLVSNLSRWMNWHALFQAC